MPDLKLMQDELNSILTQQHDVETKYADQAMPDDVRREYIARAERGLGLRALIEDEQLGQAKRANDDLARWSTDPAHQITKAINDDDDGRAAMRKAGWQFKGGAVVRETSQGDVVMYDERVLFGPIPSAAKDADVANYCKQTRAIFQPAYREAFIKWMTATSRVETAAIWSSLLSADEQKALSEGTDSAGGYLVPPDLQGEVLIRLPQQSVFNRLARTVPTSRDRLVFPRVQPAAATASGLASGGGSVFSSGFIGSWAGETPAFTDVDAAFGQFDISVKKARAATKLGNDFISDAVIDVPSFLANNGADNLALVEDQGFISGDGAALQPLGILNGGSATVDVEGPTSNTIGNTTTQTGTAPKLIDLVYNLPAQYAERAVWLMRRLNEGKVRKLVDGQGRFLWPLGAGSMFGGPNGVGQRTLLDYPVYNSDFVPADGADTNKVFIFGDLSAYIIARRTSMSVSVLRERFADNDQTGFILWDRVGGALWNDDAVRFGVV